MPLLALLEERSVTKAASKIGLSQPAMSHGLTRMRRMLSDELLVRQGRGMVLTPRAAELLPALRQTLTQTARLVNAAPFDPATDSRLITVAMTNSTAFVIGSGLTRLLAERAPNTVLRLRTTSSPTIAVFAEDAADVILLPETFATPYPRERLYDDRWVVVTSWDSPREASALELLETVPHVVLDAPRNACGPMKSSTNARSRTRSASACPTTCSFPPDRPGRRGGGPPVSGRPGIRGPLRPAHGGIPFPIQTLGIDIMWNPWLAEDP